MRKKVAVISGGNGYVGSAVSRALSDAHFEVISLSRGSAYACDVTDRASVRAAFEKIKSEWGAIDVCIHAASAPLKRKKIGDVDVSDLQDHFNVSTLGAFHLFVEAQEMFGFEGVFIGITTEALAPGVKPEASGGYVPAKAALQAFLKVCAAQYPKVKVYAIAPGFLPGGLNSDLPGQIQNFIVSKSKHLKNVDDIAGEVTQLVSGQVEVPSGSLLDSSGPHHL